MSNSVQLDNGFLSHPVFPLVSRVAEQTGVRAFVIGGFVRDCFLGRPTDDIDIVVEGSGIDFAMHVADAIKADGKGCKIVGASFKNVAQLTDAIADGAEAVTVPPELLDTALAHPSIDLAVENFRKDWVSVYGDRTPADL